MRRFGIEIEFGGDVSAAASALRTIGMSSGRVMSYSTNEPAPNWTIKRDGSVSYGGEMVSPPLDFDDDEQRAQVNTALAAIKGAGAHTDNSAGIHVHVDASDLTAKQVAAVARLFTKFEDVLYRCASSGWAGGMRSGARQYCKPLTQEMVTAIARAKDENALGRAYYGVRTADLAYRQASHHDHARYYGINIHSWFYRKTIEFRIFNSSMNAERIQGYIAICVALVEDARRGNVRSVNRAYRLGGMAQGTTNERNAYHRFLQVLRYEAGLSLEDMKRINRIWKDSRPQNALTSSTY